MREISMIKAIRIILIAVIAVMIVTLGVAAYQAIDGADRLTVQLNGDQKVYVEYGNTYVEQGAKVQLRNSDETVDIPVQIQGSVDTSRIGLYRMKYTAQSGDRISTVYRNVYVVDTQKPVITLKENPGSFTLINEPYVEEGFTATDNYDGDLTGQVIRREADGVVTYTVTDSFGNTASVVRTINYIDPGIPNIQLVGGQLTFIMAGDIYEEPGYTAVDTHDGDITASVVVSGAVDNLNSGVMWFPTVLAAPLLRREQSTSFPGKRKRKMGRRMMQNRMESRMWIFPLAARQSFPTERPFTSHLTMVPATIRDDFWMCLQNTV